MEGARARQKRRQSRRDKEGARTRQKRLQSRRDKEGARTRLVNMCVTQEGGLAGRLWIGRKPTVATLVICFLWKDLQVVLLLPS